LIVAHHLRGVRSYSCRLGLRHACGFLGRLAK
jgi:hypothetical protein